MRWIWIASTIVLLLSTVAVAGEREARVRKRTGGYLGFFLREADGKITIERLHPGSVAEEVGFKAGDVVESVNGRELPNGDAFVKRLWSRRPLRIAVRRGEDIVEVETSTQALDSRPKVGDPAPGFELKAKDGRGKHALAKLLKKGRPVVLIFGSFT